MPLDFISFCHYDNEMIARTIGNLVLYSAMSLPSSMADLPPETKNYDRAEIDTWVCTPAPSPSWRTVEPLPVSKTPDGDPDWDRTSYKAVGEYNWRLQLVQQARETKSVQVKQLETYGAKQLIDETSSAYRVAGKKEEKEMMKRTITLFASGSLRYEEESVSGREKGEGKGRKNVVLYRPLSRNRVELYSIQYDNNGKPVECRYQCVNRNESGRWENDNEASNYEFPSSKLPEEAKFKVDFQKIESEDSPYKK